MKNTFTLSVPKPCSERWENFTPEAGGGFCSSCSKVVVDFTAMDETSIVRYFKTKPQHTCGRFRADQLKRYDIIAPAHINPGYTLLRAGFAALLLLFLSRPAAAQTTVGKVFAPQTQSRTVSQPRMTAAVGDVIIKGRVKSPEDSSAYPGVNVVLKGTATGTVTNAEGKFEFPEKLKAGDVLVFSFIGFVSYEYTVPPQSPGEITISMVPEVMGGLGEVVMLGEVADDGLYTERPSLFKRLWTGVKNIF